MDNHIKPKRPPEKVSPAQRSLLRELGKQFTNTSYNERTECRAKWDAVADQLNALEGAKNSGLEWRRIWWCDNSSRRRKNKDKDSLNENARRGPQMATNVCDTEVRTYKSPASKKAAALQVTEPPDTRKSDVNLSLDFLHKHSKVINKDTLNEIAALNNIAKTKECSTQAQEGLKSATLIAIASTLHDIKTNNVVSDLRIVTKHKLHLLLCADDYHVCLLPASRMSITDWLLFDTVLVHEPFDVIQMSHLTKLDKQPLMDLFELVKKYNVEALMGEQLAMAWAAVTLEYNKKGRMCTPMLLQRRWYQLKLATKERFLQFQSVVMNPNGNQDLFFLKIRKPTSLQTAIVARFKTLVTKPFMSWEERIKHKLVILRDQFESIALRKRNMPDTSEAAIIPVPETIDLTDAAEETDSQPKPGEFETITVKETNQNIFIDENEPCEEQEMYEANRINNDPLDRDSNDNDIENHLPYNTISVESKQEPVLPKITNIFGNVNIPIENLPQISEIAEQLASNTNTGKVANEPKGLNDLTAENAIVDIKDEPIDISANEPKGLNDHTAEAAIVDIKDEPIDISANEPKGLNDLTAKAAIVDIKDEPIDISEETNLLMDAKMHCEIEIVENPIGQINMENYVDVHEIVEGDKKSEDLKLDKKLLMTPIVKTVKLDDMGILPIDLLTHVDNKAIIDVINFKSKPAMMNTGKRKDVMTLATKKVNLSSALFKKPRNCTYNSEKLSNNPDFNIVLKKLNHRFFKSESNRLLLRACKPLCVNVSKAFENKLVNGILYLNTDVDSHKQLQCEDNNKKDSLTSVEFIDNTTIDNTVASKAHENHSIEPMPKESVIPPEVPISNNSNNIAKVAYQKYLTQKDNPDEPFESNNSLLPDITTVDALLCIIADVEKTKPTLDPISLDNMGDINVHLINETNTNNKFITINPMPNYEPSQCCWAREKIEALKTKMSAPPHPCVYKRCSCCCKDLLAVFSMNLNTKQVNYEETDKQTVDSSTQTNFKQIKAPSTLQKLPPILPKTDTVKLKPESQQLNIVQNNQVNGILTNILHHLNHPTQTYPKQSNAPSNEKHEKLIRILPKPDTVIRESKQLNEFQNAKSILANRLQYVPKKSPIEFSCNADVIKKMLQNFTEPSIDKHVYLGKNKILLTTAKIPKHFKKFSHFQHHLEKVLILPKGVALVLRPNGQALLKCKSGADPNVYPLARFTQLVDEFNKLYSTDTSQRSNNIENDKINDRNNVNKTPDAKETNQESNTTNVNFSTGVNDEVNFESIHISNVKTITEEQFAPQSGSIQPNQKHRNDFVHAMRSCLGPVLRKALTPIQSVSELKYAYSQKGLFFKLNLDGGSLVPINLRIKQNQTAKKSKKSKSVPKEAKTTIPTGTNFKTVQYNFSFEDPVTGIKESVLLNIDPLQTNCLQNNETQTVNKNAESIIPQQESSESEHQQLFTKSIKQEANSSESINASMDFEMEIDRNSERGEKIEIEKETNVSNATVLITDTRMISLESYENKPTTSTTDPCSEVIIKEEKT